MTWMNERLKPVPVSSPSSFRQLFGYQVGLSLSLANGAVAPLSLSLGAVAAPLSMMELAPLSLGQQRPGILSMGGLLPATYLYDHLAGGADMTSGSSDGTDDHVPLGSPAAGASLYYDIEPASGSTDGTDDPVPGEWTEGAAAAGTKDTGAEASGNAEGSEPFYVAQSMGAGTVAVVAVVGALVAVAAISAAIITRRPSSRSPSASTVGIPLHHPAGHRML